MDFSVRSGQPVHHTTATNRNSAATDVAEAPSPPKSRRSGSYGGRGLRIISVILLFSVTVLLIAIALSIYYGSNAEIKLVNTNEVQAVAVSATNGPTSPGVYYGTIKTLTDKYVVLNSVYYVVPQASTTSSTSVVVAPLSCQLGKPVNQLVINRDSLLWWQNLQPSGNVTTAINDYTKQNPNSQPCPTPPTPTITPTTTTTTPATTKPATPSTSTTTTPAQ